MPPQAKPAPSSPPKLRGRHKCQPSNPEDMNKHPKPNNSDPSDSEHARPSKSTTAGKKSTTTQKKVQKKGTKKQCVACLFIIIIIIDFYSTYRKTAAQRVAEDAAASSAHLTPYFPFKIYFSFIAFFLQIRMNFGGQPPHRGPSAMLPNLTISPKPR